MDHFILISAVRHLGSSNNEGIENELQNHGGKETGIEEFESIQEMLEKRYEGKN